MSHTEYWNEAFIAANKFSFKSVKTIESEGKREKNISQISRIEDLPGYTVVLSD